MKLRGIEFGPVLCASGTMGFFGEKYFHQKLLGPFGPNFKGCTFVAKTTTLQARLEPEWGKGIMPMKQSGITPKEWIPKCIYVDFRKGIMLNAVGLSGPGAKTLFMHMKWQQRTEPFFISFMPVGKTLEKRIEELEEFVKLFLFYLPRFRAKVGLQINYSCPNVGVNPDELIAEAETGLNIAAELDIPNMPKFNVLMPQMAARQICQNKNCDAICVSNTIPWGKLPEKINWKELFGTDVSPLAQFGGGGLSGKPLLKLVADWLMTARFVGISKPINVGGGILSPDDVDYLFQWAPSSISIGSVATLRPWRVQKIIRRAHQLFERSEQ